MTDIPQKTRAAFDRLRDELKFSSTFEDVDSIFFIVDSAEAEGFVSSRFSRALARRISNLFWNWNNYLHNLIVPNPNSMVIVAESQMFSEQERATIIDTMNKIMAHVTKNSLISLDPSPEGEASFIDDSVAFWKEVLQPKLVEIFKKISREWDAKAAQPHVVEGGPRHP